MNKKHIGVRDLSEIRLTTDNELTVRVDTMLPIPITPNVLKYRHVDIVPIVKELLKVMKSKSLPLVGMGPVVAESAEGTRAHVTRGSD